MFCLNGKLVICASELIEEKDRTIHYKVQQMFAPVLKFMFYDASVYPKYGTNIHFLETTLGK